MLRIPCRKIHAKFVSFVIFFVFSTNGGIFRLVLPWHSLSFGKYANSTLEIDKSSQRIANEINDLLYIYKLLASIASMLIYIAVKHSSNKWNITITGNHMKSIDDERQIKCIDWKCYVQMLALKCGKWWWLASYIDTKKNNIKVKSSNGFCDFSQKVYSHRHILTVCFVLNNFGIYNCRHNHIKYEIANIRKRLVLHNYNRRGNFRVNHRFAFIIQYQ